MDDQIYGVPIPPKKIYMKILFTDEVANKIIYSGNPPHDGVG